MLRSRALSVLVCGVLLAPGVARAGVTVFQDPSNSGNPAAPAAQIVIGAPAVSLNLWYQQTGGAVSAPSTACLSGTGDEVCGWDVYVSGTGGMVLGAFTPDAGAGSDVVGAVTGNVLRVNGGNPISGETGVHRIGSLLVSATAAGNLNVTGNLYVTAALGSAAVTPSATPIAVAITGSNDPDLDGVLDPADNCPSVANGPAEAGVANVGNQTDSDGDGVGDACDNCRTIANPRVLPDAASYVAANPWATLSGGQRDDDHDGFGNKCDAKFTTAGTLVGSSDLTQFRASSGKSRLGDTCGTSGTEPCARYDLDEGSTLIGSGDLSQYRTLSGKAPGPKCPACTGTGSAQLPCVAGTSGTCN